MVADRPGLSAIIGLYRRLQANVVHVYHDRVEHDIPIGQALVEIGLETGIQCILKNCCHFVGKEGYQVQII